MNLSDVMTVIETVGLVGIVIVLGSLIKIKPLEINIWSWLARCIGNALNHDTMVQINEIKKKQQEIEDKLDGHIAENEEDQILRARKNILVFAREIVSGQRHTREEYQETLLYIDAYEKYCEEHPKFPNNRAVLAISMIKENYHERLEKADFLAEEYRPKKEKAK